MFPKSMIYPYLDFQDSPYLPTYIMSCPYPVADVSIQQSLLVHENFIFLFIILY